MAMPIAPGEIGMNSGGEVKGPAPVPGAVMAAVEKKGMLGRLRLK